MKKQILLAIFIFLLCAAILALSVRGLSGTPDIATLNY
jgi:hypothetical protein